MTKLLLVALAAATLALSTGCLFSKKKPKESSAIAGEVEETFRRRWLDKRVAELVAQGTAADAARLQADTEFQERYSFAKPVKK